MLKPGLESSVIQPISIYLYLNNILHIVSIKPFLNDPIYESINILFTQVVNFLLKYINICRLSSKSVPQIRQIIL